MKSIKAWHNGEWVAVKNVYAFHHGIGYVKLQSIKVHDGQNWVVCNITEKDVVKYRSTVVLTGA